jgi:hypothetical protein
MRVADDFTGLVAGANLSTRLPWVQRVGVMQGEASGDRVTLNNGANESVYAYTGPTFPSNQYAEAVVSWTVGTTARIGPAVRIGATGSCYAFVVLAGGASHFIGYFLNGVLTTIVISATGPAVSGTTVRLNVDGTTLTGFVDNVLVGTGTHALLTTGIPGLCGIGALDVWADDWAAGFADPIMGRQIWMTA